MSFQETPLNQNIQIISYLWLQLNKFYISVTARIFKLNYVFQGFIWRMEVEETRKYSLKLKGHMY